MISTEDSEPSTGLSSRHECPPGGRCPPWDSPCPFTLSSDPDRLADLTERRLNRAFHKELWRHFLYPSARSRVSAAEGATYAAKFDRCKRVHDRRPQIIDEIRTNENRFLAERGFPFELLELEPYENVSGEEGDAIPKEIKKALGMEEKAEDSSGEQ